MRDSTPVTVYPSDASSADTDVLIERLSTLERCQRQTTWMASSTSSTRQPSGWNGAGRRLIGRDEIGGFTRQVLGRVRDGLGELRGPAHPVHPIRCRPDRGPSGVRRREGRPAAEGAFGSPSYDMWKIIAGQNTSVIQHVSDKETQGEAEVPGKGA